MLRFYSHTWKKARVQLNGPGMCFQKYTTYYEFKYFIEFAYLSTLNELIFPGEKE